MHACMHGGGALGSHGARCGSVCASSPAAALVATLLAQDLMKRLLLLMLLLLLQSGGVGAHATSLLLLV